MFDNIVFDEQEIRNMSPTTLAFIGDGVYDLYARLNILKEHPRYNNHALTKEKFLLVKAKTQADALKAIMEFLDEEELTIVKRGRNAKTLNVPKGSSMSEYHMATAFETLIGYLWLYGKKERAIEIMQKAISERKN